MASTRSAAFDLIEIPALDPGAIDIADTRNRLINHGLEASYSLGLTLQTDINSEDLASVERGRQVLMTVLEVARGTGSRYLCGVLFGARAKYPGPTTDPAARTSAAVIKELAQEAAEHEIRVCLEFVNRCESNLLNTVSQTLRYIDAVDEPNMHMHALADHGLG